MRDIETSFHRLKWFLSADAFQRAGIRVAAQLERKYRPDQPRVPAGNPDGGQWTGDSGAIAPAISDPQTSTPVVGPQTLAPIVSDANPDLLVPGAQYAQTDVTVDTSALTGISTIDDITKKLTATLAGVMEVVDYTPGLTPQQYGTLVHQMFAGAVLVQGLPGIGWKDIETTFGGDYYGAKGSIRTDVVLRNDSGDVIAIYDVKTGNAEITPRRAAEIRQKTGTNSSVPIIQMSFSRGILRKFSRTRQDPSTLAVSQIFLCSGD